MRLSAIYIDEHEHLFDNPQTVNFGGKYFYDFEKEDKTIIIKRKVNEAFINDFFDLTALSTKLTHVNAIVGQNGAGKSSLLDVIRSTFIDNKYALSYSNAVFIYETDNSKNPQIISSEFRRVYLDEKVGNKSKRVELNSLHKNHVRTIYYSPHFDYKYNPNFDNIDNHDLSFDKLMDEDLKNLSEKDNNANGFSFSPVQELLLKNSLRQIEFLSSDLIIENKIFKDLFELQEHYEPMLIVRGYTDDRDRWNTPERLRSPIDKIYEKIEEESANWHTHRRYENEEYINQPEVHGYILKRNLLKAVLSLIIKQAERNNLYLREGQFPVEDFNQKIESFDAYTALIFFIENASLKVGETKRIFKDESLKTLIDEFYKAVDNVKTKEEIDNTTLKTSKEATIKILNLQKNFLSEVNKYYSLFDTSDKTISKDSRVEEIINYMPFSRKMSSGENALLNFFSRLYNFISFNFKDNKFFEERQHYLLLLDEADLSFHPKWKKKYVKALLKTLPYFFNDLKSHPSIQIIFTTHDPLTLSDLPNSNVVYLERRDYNSKTKVLDYNDENRPTKTFGANISDLLADSFFVEDSLIGEFAFDKIKDTIEWLENKNDSQNTDYYEKLIKAIDEPIVQRKLAEMYDDKMQTQVQLNIVNDQIAALEALRKKLEK